MSYIGYSHAANHIAPPHIRETLSPDGSATYFDLSNDVVGYHEENVTVVVNNVIQEPYASYTIINDASNRPRRLDFAGTALASTDDLYVIHQGTGTLYNTPAAGSVTKTSMAANMVSHTVDKKLGSDASNGSTRTQYLLSEEPTNADAISVYVNGVYQRSGAGGANNYDVSGSTLTFTSSLATTDQIDVHHHTFRSTLTKVADNSVGDAQLASGTLTTKGALVTQGAITGAGLLTTGGNIVIPNAGNIGSAGDTDAIAIASGGDVTMTQNLVVNGNMTVSGTTTTVDTTLTLSDAMVINNAGSDVGLKINSTSTGNIVQLQDGGVDKFVIADGGNITAVGNLGLTGNSTLTGTLTVSSTITSNGDIVVDNNSKVKQKGAFMQSSTHQAFFFGK